MPLRALPRTALGASGIAFEDWFADLLQRANVPFERASQKFSANVPRAYQNVDFAVSANELSHSLGDSLPVELIVGPVPRVIAGRRKVFESYLAATDASTVLVVSAQLNQPTSIWPMTTTGEVLACSALAMVHEMRSATFGAAVLALHSAAVQGDPIG